MLVESDEDSDLEDLEHLNHIQQEIRVFDENIVTKRAEYFKSLGINSGVAFKETFRMFPNTFELFYQFLIGHGLGIYFIPINLIIILLYILYNSLISSFYLFIYIYITVGSDIKIETRITPLIQTFIFVEWVAQGLTTRY
jgi:hypothetical protein